MDNPYKILSEAFVEVFNYWLPADAVDILVKKSTTASAELFFQDKPLIVNRKDNVKLGTYGDTIDPDMARILVLNTKTYEDAWDSAYSLMKGIPYDFAGVGSNLLADETKAIESQWYSVIVIQCDFTMDGFYVTNELKLEDDDFAIVHPISNLAPKSLTINNCEFNQMYGTVMQAFTTLSFNSLNVKIDTEKLVGGFVFLVTCDPAVDVTTGDVVIDNLRFDGLRSILFKYGGIYMTGPQNFTIQNSYIGSYGFMFDAKQLTRADSPLNCQPDDGVEQIITLQNNVYNMSETYSGTPHHGFICSFLEWYPRHNFKVYFLNNTLLNIQKTFYRVLLLDVNWGEVVVRNNTFKDTTGAVDIAQVKTTKTVIVEDNVFRNISSTSQNVFVIQASNHVNITNFLMNGAHPDAVSSGIIYLNMAEVDSKAYLLNINFTNNQFQGTKAIVSQQLLDLFQLTDSVFEDDQLLHNTLYIDIQKAKKIMISDTTFTNMRYINEGDSGAYLVYIERKYSSINNTISYIQNITFTNIKTNTLSFGGFFAESDADIEGDFIITDVLITDSLLKNPDSLISTKKFSYTGDSKLIIQNSNFTNLNFEKFGNLIELTHNAKQPIIIRNVIFYNIYGAGIRMEPQDIFDKTNPLSLTISNCTLTDNTPWDSGFLNIFENSIVEIINTDFRNMFSVGSGSVILANYKGNQITITNSTFIENYAILGGVFYSQFSSSIICNNCTFQNNLAIRGGLAFLNSNGKVQLDNSTILQNQALNAPVLYISACQADFSTISNSQLYENSIVTMENLLIKNGTGLDHISDSFIEAVLANREFYEKSVSGSKKSSISMIKGKIRISNG
jgi:hypothetical protein